MGRFFGAGRVLWLISLLMWPTIGMGQSDALTITTVSRAPFSMPTADGGHTGFSIELFSEIAAELERDVVFDRRDTFSDMLAAVQSGTVEGAVANISITSEREAVMDFSQPIFRSGLRIMVPFSEDQSGIAAALFTRQIATVVLAALGLLFVVGMVMWVVERNKQPYFDRPFKQALFPSFWWALNLVVNGGFEERVPQSAIGRVFSVILVVSSLFIVSIFVAQITAATTVQALQSSINDIDDLNGKRVGTIQGATAAAFLQNADVPFIAYDGLEPLIEAFEANTLDAVIFDAPILAYYTQQEGAGIGKLTGRLYRPENYGIALPTGSPLLDEINQALLRLRENGTYDALQLKWFGAP
ncbi:transporter substrate-binding domain-containing protein [Shimia ponticola]|uniref:transporter substrate-binding domain-containing protein n=1 Tax=Shimia ponticola TaxID=2582893 RepID=UPI0011BE9ECD|nr:transporter substrate-binding domain-containing protein [Shimia ponticola]